MRFRTVLVLEGTIIAIGALGALWLSEILDNDLANIDFGATALMTLILAALALLRRSWARIPTGGDQPLQFVARIGGVESCAAR